MAGWAKSSMTVYSTECGCGVNDEYKIHLPTQPGWYGEYVCIIRYNMYVSISYQEDYYAIVATCNSFFWETRTERSVEVYKVKLCRLLEENS